MDSTAVQRLTIINAFSYLALFLVLLVPMELSGTAQSSAVSDLDLSMGYAEAAEKAGSTEQALRFYALALETDARYEPAHFGRSNLLFRMGRRKEAYDAVSAGLSAAPESARLHIIKIDLLEQDDRIFDMREAVRVAADVAPENKEVLRRLAQVCDVFGSHAGEAYERWAVALDRDGAGADSVKQVLQRGLVVALRDGERESARRISARLEQLGVTRFSGLAAVPQIGNESPFVLVPGGIAGIAAAIGLESSIPAKRFLTEYARAILKTLGHDKSRRNALAARVRLYLEVVQALKTYGQPVRDGVEVIIDIQTGKDYDRADKILALLGWRLRRSQSDVTVELRSGPDAATRQSYAAALPIDEAEMKASLEERRSFRFEIRDEQVSVIFSEQYWFAKILNKEQTNRTLLQELLENLPACRLYVGLAGLSDETQRTIFDAVSPELLLRKASLLSLFGSSITLENGHLVLPGEDEALSAWSALAGVSPLRTAEFIRTLLNKDGGKLLAYYYCLAILPRRNQRFFTRTSRRTASFYEVFPFLTETPLDAGAFVLQDDPFARLARELPLDDDGNIRFPGSQRIWTLAKGSSTTNQDFETLWRRAEQATSPDTEDEILLRMLKQKYNARFNHIRQIENFLAVVRIDRHRQEPMDELMALSLSQNYAKYHALFPYLVELQTLSGPNVVEFFRAAERLEHFYGNELNTALGEFHALVKLIVLLRATGALTDSQAVELLSATCKGLAGISNYHALGRISFEAIAKILAVAGYDQSATADEFLVRALAGTPSGHSIDLPTQRAENIREVLRQQEIRPLEDLLAIYRSMAAEQSSKGGAEPAAELIEHLNQDLKTTLVGWIYAWHFSPRDLAVAGDTDFSRRHEFFDRYDTWSETRAGSSPGSTGFRITGGFAQMSWVVGTMAMVKVEMSESMAAELAQRSVVSSQLASIRSVPWNRVDERSMHLVALKMRLAREFVVQAALDAGLRKNLAEATIGLIGPRRRFDLLQDLAALDVRAALAQLSSSDLIFLADALASAPYPETLASPTAVGLRRETVLVPREQSNYFGGYHVRTDGCAHPHLTNLGPYEDFENLSSNVPLAERLSHFLLDLADAADRERLPVEVMALLAEAAVQRFAVLADMSTEFDWTTALEAMGRIDLNALLPLLEKN